MFRFECKQWLSLYGSVNSNIEFNKPDQCFNYKLCLAFKCFNFREIEHFNWNLFWELPNVDKTQSRSAGHNVVYLINCVNC